MKKAISLIVALVLCLCLCACGENTPADANTTTNGSNSSSSVPTDTEGTTEATITTTVPETTESEDEKMQKLIDYNKALDLLDSLNTYFSCNQLETMSEAYALLVSLGDYKDVPQLLSRFTECTYKKDTKDLYTIYDNQGVYLAKSSGEWEYRCVNTFDDKGRLVRVDNINELNSYYQTYEYDDAGQLIRENIVYEYQSTCYTYEYDADGNLITQHRSYQNINSGTSENTTHFTYTFDEAGRIIKEREENNGQYMEYTYTYDENGMLIGKDSYASSNGSLFRYTYEYDQNGNMITIKLAAERDGKITYSETTYSYTTIYFYTPPQP